MRFFHQRSAWLEHLGEQLTLPQFKVLLCLDQIGPCSLKDLAAALDVANASASAMVDKLVESGHLTRETDPEDRRAIRLYLTDKAREFMDKKGEEFVNKILILMDGLGPERSAEWLRIMEALDTVILSHFESQGRPTLEENTPS